MSKAILVIDTPSVCADCPASKLVVVDHAPHFMCGVTGKLVPHDIKVSGFRKGLCPAIPLGKRIEEYKLETWNTKDGIFLCEKGLFDEIYGDEEE